MSLNVTLWDIFVEHQIDFIFMINLQLCQCLELWGVLQKYLSIICYDDAIFNFYYFIVVLIGKTC